MKTRVTVIRVQNGWAVIDNNRQVGDLHNCEQSAHLHAHHYRYAPSLLKTLRLKKVDGVYTGRPFWGVQVAVYKETKNWVANITIDDKEHRHFEARTRDELLRIIAKIGSEKTTTHNILNPEFGEIEISRASKGSCTDPGTETYHCM